MDNRPKSTDLSSFDNSWYDPGRGWWIRAVWYCVNLLIFKSGVPSSSLKVFLLRVFGARIGDGVVIKPCVNIKYPWKLSVGNNVWIGESVWIDNLGQVTLGSNVCLSQGALLLCGNHDYKKASFDLIVGDIHLKSGVWIAARAVVCAGVTCHEESMLTAGSVTSSDLAANTINCGNPATHVRDRDIANPP